VTNEDWATTDGTWAIEPATVTINSLTINGKQATVDVFRQLKEAVLINHDGSLAGSPWGLVNYHQKRCDMLEKHEHVVWQLGNQLRQDTIQQPRWEPYWSDVCDALVFAAGTVEEVPTVTWWPPPKDPVRPRRFSWSRPKYGRKSQRDPLQPPEDRVQPLPENRVRHSEYRWSRPKCGRQRYREGMEELIFLLDGMECSGHPPPDRDRWGGPDLSSKHSAADTAALLAQLKEQIAAEKERRARHEVTWAAILDLPQLFIAV
jgi:hypothetical protein